MAEMKRSIQVIARLPLLLPMLIALQAGIGVIPIGVTGLGTALKEVIGRGTVEGNGMTRPTQMLS